MASDDGLTKVRGWLVAQQILQVFNLRLEEIETANFSQ
jgi:hypothetical protein